MASRSQGITVEIGGGTTKLSKALEGVNKSIKGMQSGLKNVNKLLKLAGVSLLAFEVYAFYIKSVARSFYSQLLLLWIPMRTKFPLCFLSAFFLMLFLIPFI